MRRIAAMICGLALVLSLSACGEKPSETATEAAPETTAVETTAAETTAAETTAVAPDPIRVRVSISNAGEVVLAGETVEVTDLDENGALTVRDALQAAHDAFYEGEDGFDAADTGYGLFVSRLWGVENGGSYGTYVNDAPINSLDDAIQDGDTVYAYSYADLTSWTDLYTFFRESEEENTWLLLGAGVDEDWNPVEMPVAGAHILLDGEDSGIVTDENGAFVLEELPKVMSAVSEEQIIVPPVKCFE